MGPSARARTPSLSSLFVHAYTKEGIERTGAVFNGSASFA